MSSSDWLSGQSSPDLLTGQSSPAPFDSVTTTMNNCTRYNHSGPPEYPVLLTVQQNYRQAHPYVAIVLCTYGVITNVINILVLTKPSMRNSINCILTGIAVADMITMSSCIPLMYHYYLRDPMENHYEFGWTLFVAIHMNLTMTSHTSSLWLGVIMATMRYLFVRPTARGAQTLDCRSTLVVILFTFLAGVLITLPNVLATGLEPCLKNGIEEWHLRTPTFGQKDSNALDTVTFFVYPIVGKIVPCILISIFGGLLLHTLSVTSQRSKRLRAGSKSSAPSNSSSSQTRRTTIMLLAIIALYIISELPQSILLLLCIFVENFFMDVYFLLGDFVDLLSLINSAMNFITYIAMSTQFRVTLKQMAWDCVHKCTCHKCGNFNAIQSTKYSKAPPTSV